MASGGGSKESKAKFQKSYFEVLGLCCSSEVALIEKILKPVHGIHRISVIVPSRTVIVVHDHRLVSPCEIVKKLNGARLEANVRAYGSGGGGERMRRWPPWQAWLCGVLWAVSCFKFLYAPLRWVALAAVVAGISQIAGRSVAALRHRRLDINVLLLIAVMGTIALKDYVEAATVVFLFTIAEWMESMASHKATTVMASLMSIAPQKAVIAATGEAMGVEDVKVGTVLAVKAGEAVPIDGVVVEGSCEVDEKTLTGESLPVAKEKGSALWAGTVNLNGYVAVRTTALAEDCVASRMVKLVEEAQNRKSRTQRFIDRCAKYYTPAIVLISAGVAAVPAALKLHDRDRWFHTALVVLVSGCPCSLILSTPVATFSALSKAATAGLLVKGGDYLETLAGIKMAAFDKTGTITRGEFEVTDFQSLTEDVSLGTLIYWVSSIESKSSHPMAAALVHYGRSWSVEPRPENVEDFQSFPGEGIRGTIDGKDIHIGNRRMAMRAGCGAVHGLEAEIRGGSTRGDIYMNGTHIGYFNLSDECRQGVAEAIQELKSLSIRSSMLTGDSHAAAQHVQTQLGNGLDEIHAELLPDDKARIIKEFQKRGPAAMVGDGVNDALALATADVGISMGISGSALAAETGHVVLMSNDIRKVPEAVKLARRCRRKVVENVVLSLVTKGTVLGLACAGRPLVSMAVLADVGTCLLVTLNSSLLLLGGRHGHGHRGEKPCKRSGHSHSFHDLHHHHHGHDHCESSNQKTVTASQPPECDSQRPLCCEEGTGLVGKFHRTPCVHPPQCDDGFDGNIHQTGGGDLPRGEEHHSCCTRHVEKTQDFDRTSGEHGPEGAEGRHRQCKLQGQSPGARVSEDMVDDAKLDKMRRNCCMRLDKREMGGCCESYRKECCGKKHWNSAGGEFGGGGARGLSEIVIE